MRVSCCCKAGQNKRSAQSLQQLHEQRQLCMASLLLASCHQDVVGLGLVGLTTDSMWVARPWEPSDTSKPEWDQYRGPPVVQPKTVCPANHTNRSQKRATRLLLECAGFQLRAATLERPQISWLVQQVRYQDHQCQLSNITKTATKKGCFDRVVIPQALAGRTCAHLPAACSSHQQQQG
jgi:hypothetical protein